MTLWIAQFESSRFLFEGVGKDEFEARAALGRAIHLHCQQTGAKSKEFFVPEEVYVRELKPLSIWRDGQAM